MEVCPLSRGMMLAFDPTPQSLSAPLQRSLRFLHPPLPAVPSARFTVAYLSGRRTTGLPCWACITRSGKVVLLSTGGMFSHDRAARQHDTGPRAFWLKPVSHFGLFFW